MIEYIVNIIPRTDGLMNFIVAWDDFQPKIFKTYEEAIDWISEQTFGKYTIIKVYNQNNKVKMSNNKQQTAVEWLVEQIEKGEIEIVYSDKIHSIKCIPEIIQQAKEMEKQQIIDAANTLLYPGTGPGDTWAEQYYNKIYGGDK
jgi:hypothetical protein